MPVDVQQARAICQATLARPASERLAHAQALCGEDAELHAHVLAMLNASENSDSSQPQSDITRTALDHSPAGATSPTHREELAFLGPPRNPDHLGSLSHHAILNILGRGGFGIVFRAFDEKLHRPVAIKVLAPALAGSASACKRFSREARAAAAINDEHVVRIHSVEDTHRPPYLVMELIDGLSLEDRLKREGPLELQELLVVGMQIAEGLAAAHAQGLIHRDIKPGNILLESSTQRVKITDFGLARAVDDASVSQAGVIAGTPLFMSPEQAEGKPLDARSDLFSLGSVLYMLATGQPPFQADSTLAVLKRVSEATPTPLRQLRPDAPDWLCALVAKLHARNPVDRFGSAREVVERLRQHLADEKAGRRIPASPPQNPRLRWLLAAVLLLVLGSVAGFFFWSTSPAPEGYLSQGVAPQATASVQSEWVSLFNGKDLTGWRSGGMNPARIVDGLLTLGQATSSDALLSERGDYENYRLRFEANIREEKVTLLFRRRDVQNTYTVHLDSRIVLDAVGAQHDGVERLGLREGVGWQNWFVGELFVQGSTATLLVNGEPFARMSGVAIPRGSIGFITDKQGWIQLKRIEILELPRGTPAPRITPAPEPIRTVETRGTVGGLSFTEAGQSLLVNDTRSVGTYDPKGEKELQRRPINPDYGIHWSLSRDAKRFAFVDQKKAAVVLDLDREGIPMPCSEPGEQAHSAAISPDGNTLVYSVAQAMYVVRLGERKDRQIEARHGGLGNLTFSPDGKYLTGFSGQDLLILDATTKDQIARKTVGTFPRLAFSRDSKLLASTTDDGRYGFCVYSLPGAEVVHREWGLSERLHALAFSPEGKHLALGYLHNGQADIWDLEQKRLAASWHPHRHEGLIDQVSALTFTPDGKALVTGGSLTFKFWELTRAPSGRAPGHP